MWDNGRPKGEWSNEQLEDRFVEMWQDMRSAMDEVAGISVMPVALRDRETRQTLGLRAKLLYKVAWELANIAVEWERRDSECRPMGM